jgi:hypothetical protein
MGRCPIPQQGRARPCTPHLDEMGKKFASPCY